MRSLLFAGLCALVFPSLAAEPDRLTDAPLVFGGSHDYPPFEWLDDEGRARGFLIDLEDAIGRQGGVVVQHRLMEWRDALAALRAGEVDVVPMFSSAARARDFLFTEPVYYLSHGIFSRVGGNVAATPPDLAGKSVAVVRGGYAVEQLHAQGIDAEITEAADIASALRLLVAGETEYALLARHTARRLIAEEQHAVDQVSRPFWPRSYVFAVRKENTALHDWLRHQLMLVQASGQYYAIYDDWVSQLEWTRPTFFDFIMEYAWLLTALVTVIVLTSLWSGALQRRVRQRTADLRIELERRKAAEEEVRFRAFHDMLTNLPNRAQFVRDLEKLAAAHPDSRLSVGFISLNGIEDVVLSFGYRVGEKLVRTFSGRLRDSGFDALGYLGSGIFSVATRGMLQPEKLISDITDPLELEDMEIDPRLSLGFTVTGHPERNAEELLRQARTALSASIENKRRWQQYSNEIEPDRNSLLLLRDYWQFGTRDLVAYFQPQVDLKRNKVVGAEALVRWEHPVLGLLMPGSFIPLLEKSGLIFRVTEWMIDTAVSFSANCRRDGVHCPVAVNIAASDLLERDLVTIIKAALDRHEARPSDVTLEMTESGLITEPARVRRVLQELGDMGISCAVDDFGTGYSSLSYLSEFPVRTVKLDRLFVGTMLSDSRHQAIVRSTIELAHELGLTVVAEGAEDADTLACLRNFGCEYAQGFVYSPALPAGKFLSYVRDFDAELIV